VQGYRKWRIADWLSRAPLLDGYCPDDGEMEKEKYKFDDEGNLIFNETEQDEVKEVSAAQVKRTRKCRRSGRYEVMNADRSVKDLTHFSSVPNALKLIAKKLEYYPVAETRLSACLLILLYS
jgi:hypothetical protein